MTNAQDYINARTQYAKEYLPNIKAQLDELIDKSKNEFVNNGEIAIKDNHLSTEISRFEAQSAEVFSQLCNWLEEFGWSLVYKASESSSNANYPHRPNLKNYYLVPTVYIK